MVIKFIICSRLNIRIQLISLCIILHFLNFNLIWAKKSFVPERRDPLLESYRWQKIDELNGKGYRCMMEDKDGNLWFGVEKGVLFYDGLHWKEFYDLDTKNPTIHSICIGPDNSVYVSNSYRILRYHNNIWEEVLYNASNYEILINKLSFSDNGNLYAGTNHGFYVIKNEIKYFYSKSIPKDFIKNNTDIEYSEIPEHLTGDYPFEVYEAYPLDDGKMMIKHKHGLIVFNQKDEQNTWEIISKKGKPWNLIQSGSFIKSSEGVLWDLNDNGKVSYFSENKWKEADLRSMFGGGDMTISIAEAKDKSIWIGEQGLISIYKDNKWRSYSAPDIPIPASSYTDIFVTSDGSVWIAGLLNDVVRLDYSDNRWIAYDNLNYFCETSDFLQWFINKEGNLISFDKENKEWLQYGEEDGLIDKPVTIYLSKERGLFVAGSHNQNAAVAWYNGTNWIKKEFPEFSWGIDYRSVLETTDGMILFGSSTNVIFEKGQKGGVLVFNPFKGDFESDEAWTDLDPIVPRAPYGLGQTENIIWLGGDGIRAINWENRTKLLDWKSNINYLNFDLPFNYKNKVDYIYSVPEDKIWICTRNYGLYYYNGTKWNVHNVDNGLLSNTIIAVLPLQDEGILLCTDKDISRFDGKSWTNHAMPDNFTMTREGGEMRQSPNGNIWINISSRDWKRRALNPDIYDPDKQEYWTCAYFPHENPPSTRITLYEKKISQPGNAILSWTGVDPWDITATEDLMYSFQIDDSDWSPFSKETKHIFLSLKNGKHTFKVRARDKDFNIDPNPATISFEVKAPLIQQPWFILLITVLITAILFQTLRVIKRNKMLLKAEIIKQKNEELEKINSALEAAKNKAEKSDKLKNIFLANLSHEIRTPMNAIMGFSEILKEPISSDEEKNRYINTIIRCSEQLLHIIDDILDISKIEADQLKILMKEVNLMKLLQDIYDIFEKEKERLQKQRIKIIIDFALNAKESIIVTDNNRLRQVLINLISNALKFTDKGSITISCWIKDDNFILFKVEDTGTGIPEDQINLIFQPFKQADSGTGRAYGGTGLGLAICKGIVSLLGGKIWVESEINIGSRFYFTIPYKTSVVEKEEKEFEQNPKWNKKVFMIVEDIDYNIDYIEKLLQKTGVKIIKVATGENAYEIVQTNDKIDLILMDIRLPGIDGYETTKAIRKINKTVPIIAQTAYADSETRKTCEDAGFNDFISKPLRRNELLKIIQNNL